MRNGVEVDISSSEISVDQISGLLGGFANLREPGTKLNVKGDPIFVDLRAYRGGFAYLDDSSQITIQNTTLANSTVQQGLINLMGESLGKIEALKIIESQTRD